MSDSTISAHDMPLTAAPATGETADVATTPHLREIASFDHQVTGVAVTNEGRIFVNFPRWTEDAPISVGELAANGNVRPYPDTKWNSWRNATRDQVSPDRHWVCVQALLADSRGYLWVLDPGAPAQSFVVPGAPKLVRIDLTTNEVVQNIPCDPGIAPQGSYLNDVRLSPDARHAYVTDSGTQGAIIVFDLAAGSARRVLDGHPSTQMDSTVTVKADGVPLRRPDGRGVDFSADGIALSPDGAYLYWQAVKGKTIFRVSTAALRNASLSNDQIGSQVETVLEHGPADGLHIDPDGLLFITAVEEHAIKTWDGHVLRTLIHEPGLVWPDTFAQSSSGMLLVTDSRIPEMNWFKPGHPDAMTTRLLAIEGI